jgi:hypothetical protein
VQIYWQSVDVLVIDDDRRAVIHTELDGNVRIFICDRKS